MTRAAASRPHIWIGATLLLAGVVGGYLAGLGPLSPPGGAVSSTAKTLGEVEPRIAINATNTPGDNDATPSVFRIYTAGSYYLTGDVFVPVGTRGIEIAASPVTIDLNGFSIKGNTSGTSGDGIASYGSFGTGLVIIRNGGIQSCATAITLNQANVLIERVKMDDNFTGGISVSSHATIADCTVTGPIPGGGTGTGINVGTYSRVTGCTVSDAGGMGIQALTEAVLERCVVINATGTGISLSSGRVQDCVVRDGDGTGINSTGSVQVTGCKVLLQGGLGISVGSRSRVAQNLVTTCGDDGISSGTDSQVSGNTCAGNGTAVADGAGIRLAATGCRVEGNNLNSNDIGLAVTGGCFVVGNTARLNTAGNFSLTGTNTVGPIITATGTITSTNPWANFEY